MAHVAQLSNEEQIRRERRKGSYHLVASRNKLPRPDDPVEEEEDMLFKFLTEMSPDKSISAGKQLQIQEAKKQLIRDLAKSQGDVTTPGFCAALEQLTKLYDPFMFDARKLPKKPHKHSSRKKSISWEPQLEGMWITLSKPRFDGCLGSNAHRQWMYSLGRMSFDMFRPSSLVCSIQGTFNPVHIIDGSNTEAVNNVPKSLFPEVRQGANVLRKYE